MSLVYVYPNGSTVTEGAQTELTAPLLVGAASYVDAVTDNSDSSYIQQQAAASDFNFITWDLPAVKVPYDRLVRITLVSRISYDSTSVNARTSVDPTIITAGCSARLRRSGDSDLLSVAWQYPMSETVNDYSTNFNVTTFASEVEAWIAALDAGSAQLQTVQGGDAAGRCTRHNIYELALLIEYESTPPLRQNQRDDIRQGQRTSRQLTARQVGYL